MSSIASEITRIQGLRDRLRTKLVSLGLVGALADLEDCTEAVEGIASVAETEYSVKSQDVSDVTSVSFATSTHPVSVNGDIAIVVGSGASKPSGTVVTLRRISGVWSGISVAPGSGRDTVDVKAIAASDIGIYATTTGVTVTVSGGQTFKGVYEMRYHSNDSQQGGQT